MGDDQKLPVGQSRNLTPGEIELARGIFGNSIDYSKVRVHHDFGNAGEWFVNDRQNTMTPNGEIYSMDQYTDDYSKKDPSTFIHEMTHVWQFQNHVLDPQMAALSQFVSNGGNYHAAYAYKADPSREFTSYNLEQQASMVQDYYSLLERQKSGDPAPKPLTADEYNSGGALARFGISPLQWIKQTHDKDPNDAGIRNAVNNGMLAFDKEGEPHFTQKYADAQNAQALVNHEQQKKDDKDLLGVLRRFINDPGYVNPERAKECPIAPLPALQRT
jgi:hypothetical protein